MFDGVHSSVEHRRENYFQYAMNVARKIDSGDYGKCVTVFSEGHQHQARMTRATLDLIDTPLIMFCEHDTSPIGDIPFSLLCDAVGKSPNVNCVRFNIFEKIPIEHNYLMLTEVEFCQVREEGKYDIIDRIKFMRTIQWSQRPHVAKTQWYRNILNAFFKPDQKTMIEDVMHSVVQSQYDMNKRDDFGLAIYTPEGNQLRSFHADGRGSDEKIIEA